MAQNANPRTILQRGASLTGWAANLLWMTTGLGLLVLIWSLIALQISNAVLLPTPWAVVESFAKLFGDGSLVGDVLASLKRVFVGFIIASVIAVPLAMLMSYFPVLRRMVLPVVNLIRPIPPIAWIPIAILWFGIGDKPSYFITAIAAFFPVFINSFFGGMSVEAQHINAAKCLGAKRRALVLSILLPSALPMIWTGLKIGLGQSWMAVVTAELIAAQSGLGYMIQVSRLNLDTSHVLVGMVTIGILGSLMTLGLGWFERFVLPWKQK